MSRSETLDRMELCGSLLTWLIAIDDVIKED